MPRQRDQLRKANRTVARLEGEVAELKAGLAEALATAAAYGKQIEMVRGAHLIRLLREAGIEYQIHSARWQVALPDGVLEVESLPVAVQAIGDCATPSAGGEPLHVHPRLLGDEE